MGEPTPDMAAYLASLSPEEMVSIMEEQEQLRQQSEASQPSDDLFPHREVDEDLIEHLAYGLEQVPYANPSDVLIEQCRREVADVMELVDTLVQQNAQILEGLDKLSTQVNKSLQPKTPARKTTRKPKVPK